MAKNCRRKPLRCVDLKACEPHVSIKPLTAVKDRPGTHKRQSKALTQTKGRHGQAREAPGALPNQPTSHAVSLQPGLFHGPACMQGKPGLGSTGQDSHLGHTEDRLQGLGWDTLSAFPPNFPEGVLVRSPRGKHRGVAGGWHEPPGPFSVRPRSPVHSTGP